jgi:ADP-ribosylglycohydrolase
MSSVSERALGALYGLAIGDALGMPTQLMSREEVTARFGILDDFRGAPSDHMIAAGRPAGSITNDTEQALLLADTLLAEGGHVDREDFARRLLAWAERARERGSLDLLGPSTSAALTTLVADGPLDVFGRSAATNGAAMRITPVGLVATPDDLVTLVDLVVEASRVTHNTSVAIAGAAAIAAGVSGGIAGGRSRRLQHSLSGPLSWVSSAASG